MKSIAFFFTTLSLTLLTTACNPETDPVTETPVVGTITVKVVTDDTTPRPIAGALVAVNDEAGTLLTTGTTNAAGEFVATNVVAGGSASVAYNDTGIGSHLVESIFDLTPDKTYTFVFTGTSTTVATAILTVAGAPFDTTSYSVMVGSECSPTNSSPPFAAFDIKSRCVQSDGKISVLAFAKDLNWKITGYAMLTDVAIPPSGIVSLDLTNWHTPSEGDSAWLRISANFTNSIDKMTYANATLTLQRKGMLYPFQDDSIGTTTPSVLNETSLKKVHFSTPKGIEAREGGNGFFLRMDASIDSPYEKDSGLMSQSNSIFEFIQLDLSSWFLPQNLLTGVVGDVSDLAHPSVLWNTPGQAPGETPKADAALTVLTWKTATDEIAAWVGFAPISFGYVQLPTLPPTMVDFMPNATGTTFRGAAAYFLDASHRAGYADAATHENVNSLLRTKLDSSTNSSLRYIGSAASNLVFNPSAPKRNSKAPSQPGKIVFKDAPRLIRDLF